MTIEDDVKAKLDTLSEWQAKRDLLESDKRALLDEVKIPEEVQAAVAKGMEELAGVESDFAPQLRQIRAEVESKLAAIVVPEEIKATLAEIDRQRQEVRAAAEAEENAIRQQILAKKAEIQKETEASTKDAYDAAASRKDEIEAEFSGKSAAADENIKKLTDEIKAEVRTLGHSVKADHFQAVYVSGRITWNTDKMEAWRQAYPFLNEARKEGEPSVTLRRI